MTKTNRPLLFFLVFFAAILQMSAIAPEELKVPNVLQGQYIADPSSLLSPAAAARVNSRLDDVKRQTTAEVGVAIVPDLDGMEVEEYANRLYDSWRIGKEDNNNGVLLIISPGARQARIQTGYGTEGALPDITADKIMRSRIIPAMRNGDLDAAVEGATEEIARVLTDPDYADELRSTQSESESIGLTPKEKEALKSAFMTVAAIAGLAGLSLLLWALVHYRRKPRKTRISGWRSVSWILLVLGVISLGPGLIWAAIALFLYRSTKKKGDPCDYCGNPHMRRVEGNEENAYLTPSQQTEKRLKSRSHDVFRCDRCGNTSIDSIDNPFSSYSVCSHCGTKAARLYGTRTLRPATRFSSGEGEKIFKCEHCGNQTRKKYVIPKTAARDAAILGALAAGSGRHRGGGGFGGGGFGGFGGGMSGGGGASGRW